MKRQLEKYDAAQREYILLMSDDSLVENEVKLADEMKSLCTEASLAAGKAIEKFAIKKERSNEDRKAWYLN